MKNLKGSTAFFIQLVAMFCNGYLLKLRGPAWAVANYSISQPAGGIPKTQSVKPCD